MSEPAREWPHQIAGAFENACRDELDAPKPGNVHVFANGGRLGVKDFERSAAAAAGPLTAPGQRVGARILGAVEATAAAVETNTNLGIILLCAPLAAAAETLSHDLRSSLSQPLRTLNRDDAELAFKAIVRASPAGLGRAERHDVFAPATGTLREAMAEAADRDRVAQQYVTDFADVFELGEPLLVATLASSADRRLATLVTYLGFLAAFPDSHIVRKYGLTVAAQTREQAGPLAAMARKASRLEDVLANVLIWDAELKKANVNPGTSADLTVATLFAHRLRSILPRARNGD
ncbi:MAG TPA: triphosphoribosyl-dephospho-CoA synthase [Pseudolabrys sp.]|jgi:triphosphoribosyl-dephospho-CoA synthase|nr:triphosphoribosyl-dephospho-CoA synthase [Pseudolabrys sp.]